MSAGNNRRPLALALLVIGVILIIVAIVYFAEPTKSLPGFMGQAAGVTAHRTKHGLAALVLGLLSLGAGGFLARGTRR